MRIVFGFFLAALLSVGAIWYLSSTSGPTPVLSKTEPIPTADSSYEPNRPVDLGVLAATTENLDPKIRAIEPPEFEVVLLDPLQAIANSWNETYSILIDRAENGDSDAQYHLARSAQACFRGPTSDAGFDEWLSTATATYYDGIGNYVSGPNPDHDSTRQQGLKILEFCRDSSREELARFPDWLEMAASSGNPRAMVNYAAEYPGDEDLDPANNSEDRQLIEERRSKYKGYLEEATELGSLDAMLRLAYVELNADSMRNRKVAFSYLYAYAWYRLRFEGSDASFKAIDWLGDPMSPLEYQEAVDEGMRVLKSENCCFKIPENS